LDPNLCQLPVGSLLSLCELSSGRLFFLGVIMPPSGTQKP
jgi:nucleoside recognition membrane protein YjiH